MTPDQRVNECGYTNIYLCVIAIPERSYPLSLDETLAQPALERPGPLVLKLSKYERGGGERVTPDKRVNNAVTQISTSA